MLTGKAADEVAAPSRTAEAGFGRVMTVNARSVSLPVRCTARHTHGSRGAVDSGPAGVGSTAPGGGARPVPAVRQTWCRER